MPVHLMDDVIMDYNEKKVRDFLIEPRVRGVTYDEKYSIQESVENIIRASLKDIQHKTNSDFTSIPRSEFFIFPDVHGRLDLFLQNLYVAGLINQEGNWCGGDRKAVLLGDLINRGTYSVETLIYGRVLQEQAKKEKGKVIVLLGNHEHCLINQGRLDFYNISDLESTSKIIRENIQKGNTVLAYGDNEKNMICVHAGVEKEILKWAIREINPKLYLKLLPDKKIHSSEIYQLMEKNRIQIEDVVSWLNMKLKEDLTANAPLLRCYQLNPRVSGVINSRKKNLTKDDQDILKDKTYKFIQFVGHTTTMFSQNLIHATSFGAVKKINHRFYVDYDLLRGNMAFVTLQGNQVYQIRNTQKGLEENFKPQEQIHKGIPPNLVETSGCYHGNTKKIDCSKWEIDVIAKLPEKKKSLGIEMKMEI
jgi:hypothetical protein